jgi:hypothetical protein
MAMSEGDMPIGHPMVIPMTILLGDLLLVATASASGGDSIGEVQSLTLQGENPRSNLNWLCLTMVLLKILFCEQRLSSW